MNNGHASEFFNLFCGVRQGCPLSPLLYIICSEILNLTIRNNLEIKGIMVMDTEVIISAYADDTTLYLKDKHSLIKAIDVLHNFQTYSGLKVNLDKSDILPLKNIVTTHLIFLILTSVMQQMPFVYWECLLTIIYRIFLNLIMFQNLRSLKKF